MLDTGPAGGGCVVITGESGDPGVNDSGRVAAVSSGVGPKDALSLIERDDSATSDFLGEVVELGVTGHVEGGEG